MAQSNRRSSAKSLDYVLISIVQRRIVRKDILELVAKRYLTPHRGGLSKAGGDNVLDCLFIILCSRILEKVSIDVYIPWKYVLSYVQHCGTLIARLALLLLVFKVEFRRLRREVLKKDSTSKARWRRFVYDHKSANVAVLWGSHDDESSSSNDEVMIQMLTELLAAD